MPDFDELLQPIMKDASLPLEDVRVKAPTPVAPTPTSLGIGGSGEGVGNVFDKLKNASMSSNFGDKGVFVTNATLDANRRYNTFNPIVTDYEDFAGQGQSALDQAANGVLKGLNLAATTVLGLGGLLYGTAKAALPGGKFSDVYNNEITRNLDEWNNKVDNEYLPNYYTATQRNASWYSTDNWLTTNFLFDKLIKNAGYAAGAIVSGNIISSGLKLAGGAIGTLAMEGATLAESSQAFKAFTPLLRNTARAFSVGKNIEAAEILRKEISTVADLTETSSKLADIAKSTNAFAQFNDLGRRGVIGLLSSAGESSFEALQTGNEFKRNLIQQYKDTHHGDEPDANALKEIDALTETVGNVSFLGNMALLGITETIQLPKLIGSSYAAEKRTANALLGKADNVVLQNGKYVAASELATPTRFGKIYSRVANIGHYVFDPKEAAQEIGQYALQVGTQNYFKKAYETRDADVWVDGVMFGFTGKDKSGKGIGALVSKEGIESGLLGGITGGLMQIKGNIQQAKAEKVNTERFLNDLNNAPTFKEAFKERLDAANRGIVLQQQQQDAVYQGDQLEAKDLKADMMHNYIAPRIKYGRFDMTMDDIAELRQLGSTEKGLASLKQQGYAGAEDTIQSYQERLSDFESVARNTEQIYRSTHLIYSGETITDEDGNKRRKYSDRVIDKMVYSASKIANYDLRLPSVNLSLAENGIDTSSVLDSIIKNNKPNATATADALNQINALDVTDTVKDALKTNLSDVIELSLRRKAFLDEYNDIKENPFNYEFLPGYEYGKDVMDKTPVDVVQKEIDEEGKKKETEKKLQIGKEYSLKEPILQEDGKLTLAPKITVLSQTLGGELEVKLPTGKTTFMSPEEFKNYNITDENNTSPEMADVLDKSIDTVLKDEKYAEVKKELDNVPEGMEVDKLGYINSLDNQDLIDAIEEEFNTRTEEIIKQKEEAEKQRKELIKAKNEIEKVQKEIELSSGDVATPEPTAIEPFDEGKLKSAAKFFASGTSISEETNDPAQAAPHIKNSREFLNNAKNFKNRENLSAFLVTPNQEEALGLKGLTALYYDGSDMSMSTDTTIGFVAQVFIEQEGGKNYFVDKNGERLGEVGQSVDINKVIFQAMPTAEIYYAAKDKNGNPIPRFRKGEKEVFEAYAKSWAAERAKLFKAPATTIKAYKFNISRGIAIENELINGVRERNQVGGVLVPESKISSQQDLININTSGTITHNGENLKFPVGRPVLQYGDTLQFLNNNKFGKEKAQNIYQVLKAMTDEFQKTKKINRKYTDFLQNVLYMRKSAQTSGNQIFIDPNTAEISLGGKRYGILDIANKENEIVDQLVETYHNINNFTLSKKFSAPFYEFTFKDGELQETEWKNYQSYLLASKNPDGSKRSVGNTPLATTVAKANPNTVPYSFKQKYATLVDFELPVQQVVKAAAVAAVPGMLGEFKMDGQTKNTFTEFKSGPIDFTGTVDENGDINVDVVQNDTITNAAKNEKLVNETIVPALKAANTFDPSADDVELVSKFVGDKLVIELMKLQQEAPKVEETPVVTPTPAPITPTPTATVSDIEAKKADIEKNKKADLEQLKTISPGNYIKIKGDSKELLKKFREYLTDVLGWDRMPIGFSNGNLTLDYLGGELKIPASVTILGSDTAILDINIEDVIEAKYNAELSALEGKPAEPGKYNPANTSAPEDEYQRVGKGEAGQERLTDSEIAAFKEWHAKNAANIPFEVLDNLVNTHDNEKAFGVFQEGVAKFYKGALKGTPYHEVAEGIWKSFLTPEQRQAIIEEQRATGKDFVDRETGKTLNYATATDQQIKERIMDDFGDFKAGKIAARSLGEMVRNFFRNIIEFFKSFVSKPSLKDELFKAIDSGKFKEFKVPEVVRTDSMSEYSRIPGLTETEKYEYVQDMLSRAANYIFGQNKKSLYDISRITSNELFNNIKGLYEGEGKYQELGENRWQMLVNKTKQSLRTLGINFNEEDRININDENITKNEYASDPFTTDWKKSSPFAIKITLATLPEVQPTNQQNESSMSLPKRIISSVKGYKLTNFSKAFATVLDKLSNTSKIGKVINKLVDLAKYDATYVRFFQRVGGNVADGTVDFSKFKDEDWRLFVNMMQVFTKQKPNALIQYTDGDSVYTAPANQFTASKQIEQSWFDNMKALSTTPKSIIKYNRETKTYNVDTNSELFPKATPKTTDQMIKFLNDLGVEITIGDYNTMKSSQRKEFSEAVGDIHAYIQKSKEIGSISGKLLGINAQLSKISNILVKITNPNQENTYFGVEGNRIQLYADNNAPSVFENEFNDASTLKELRAERTELNDVFSTNSVILKEGGEFFNEDGDRIKSLKVSYIQGSNNLNDGKGTTTSRLTLGNRATQEINQNLSGNYYILIPADSSREWMMDLGNHIKFDDIATGRAWTKINTVFKGYLMDDVALALDYENREKLKSVGDKAKELRFFKDILSEKNLTEINQKIEEGETQDDIKKYIDENIKDINESIKGFIEDTIERTQKMLIENGELRISNVISKAADTYVYPGLSTDFTGNKDVNIDKFDMSQDDLNNTLLFANVNYIINNIEFHKILFGDPYQFKIEKGKLDETKRIKSFLSPRRTTFDSPLYNTFLNQNYNNAGEIALEAPTDESFGDPGYHTFDSSTNTVTVKDVVLSSENYPEINQADAASWIKDTTYREVKLKNGQWSTEAEAWHQWQMAYTRQNLPGYEYTSEALKKHDEALVKTPEPQYVTDVLKPIVSGVKAGAMTIDLVLDKFSQMPVYFKAVQGTNLENLYTKMWKEKVGYVIMESGRKVGAQKLHSLYKDGKFNEAPFAQDTMVQVPWKSYGIQVENSFENPKEQTRGSQLTKLFSLDFFNDGQATEAAKKEYDNNKDILDRMHENAYTQLLNKLGIEDLGTSYKMINPAAVSETLKNEMLRRALPENAIDTIELDENGQFPIPFEASPEYQQIKNILYSMVDKSLVSPKMNGAPHVQVPVTMWEKSGGESNTTLAFYSKGKTQTNPCEVMLPHWFKERLNSKKYPTEEALLKYLNGTEEGRSILRGVGFRIPTQSMSSVEVFKVKGFLPKSMGYTVVVPSEITAKAGSDFDIDKLNMYLKATYIDKNGDIRLISLRGDEVTTKEFFSGVFDEKLEKKKINKAELLEATQILAYGLDDPNNLVDRYSDILDSVLEGTEDSSEYEAKVISEIEKLGDKTLQATLKEKFVNNMYKKALENEYYKSLENMILLPENYERLLAPVGDAGLKKVAGELDVLRKDDENTIPNRLLNRSYMTSLRNSFVTGKKWVGIAAVNITGQSVTQKSQIYIDPNRFNLVSDFDKKILGNGQIVLPHNTTKVNGVDLISISGNKTADGKEYISDRLSGYATAFVDVAKDPYIMKIIQSNSVVGTFMFLERIGAGKKTIDFLNQPIITEYLKYLNSIGKSGLFGKADIDFIMDQFPCTKQEFKDAGIDVGALKGNIETYYEKGSFTDGRDNAIQQKILREFLKYAKMAEYSFKLTQASNYDTTKFKSGDALFKKQLRTEIARESNIFSSVDKVLEGTFIGNQSELIDKSMSGMGAILKLESDQFRDISDRVLEPFARREFMSDDDYEKLGNKIKASFLDYIIQTKSGINNDINSLLVDPTTSIAKQLAAAKKKYPEMKILNDLVIDSSKRMDGAKTIKLKANDKADALETNMYIEMMRELKAVDPELYNNIVNVAILQGSYQSAVSIKNIIPIEDYSAKISDIINTLADTEDVKAFSKGAFERNNWRDDLIVPTVDKLLFIPGEAPIGEQTNQFGDHIADIFQYTSPIFPNQVLDTRALDRKILKIDPKYNYVATQSDFIKVPRVITSTMDKEKVDMLTGKTVTSLTYREKLKAGDLSLFDYFGYQKVKDELGNPLVTNKGEFIYKLINLYGDGQYASEYRLDGQPSSIDNGTIKIDNEIPNKDLIQYFAPKTEEKVLPSQPEVTDSKTGEIFTTKNKVGDSVKLTWKKLGITSNAKIIFIDPIEDSGMIDILVETTSGKQYIFNVADDGIVAKSSFKDGFIDYDNIDNETLDVDGIFDLVKSQSTQNKIEPDGLPPIDNTNENSCA